MIRRSLFLLSLALAIPAAARASPSATAPLPLNFVTAAVRTPAPRWQFIEPRRYREMPETFALQTTALAAHAAPDFEIDGRPLADHLVAKLRHFLVTPETYPDGSTREPEALGGIGGWSHQVPANALLLAKRTPAVWSRLSVDEKSRADLLMQALAVAGHWCLDDDNTYYVLMDGETLFHRSWNPNHVEGYVGVMVAASLYFGADELNTFFRTFDFDRFAARLEAANFRNILRCWTWTPALRDRLMFGGELAVPAQQVLVPGLVTSGRGVRNDFTYDGMTLDEPWALYRSQAMRVFSKAVRNNVIVHGDLTGEILGHATGAKSSPWNGQTGFIFEFETMDWSGLRTNLAYAYDAAMIDLMTATTLKELGEWRNAAGGDTVDRRMAVGMADLLFRFREGYSGWANGKAGTYDWNDYFVPIGAESVVGLWKAYFKPAPPPTHSVPVDTPIAARVLENTTVFADANVYAAWPDIARLPNGTLVATFCATDEHLGPDGRILLTRSTDQGHTWSEPIVAYDSPLDDREGGLTVAPDGTLTLHVWSTAWTPEAYAKLAPNAYPTETIAQWSAHVATETYRAAATAQGGWVLTSRDGGLTWANRIRGPDAVHGGIVLDNGTWMTASYREDEGQIGIQTAPTSRGPWTRSQTLETPASETLRFGEPHLAQLPSGRLVVLIRSTAVPYDDRSENAFLYTAVSDDRGATWTTPIATERWGFPPHLTTLADGRLLATYGYRRPPYGQRASLSSDGLNWTETAELVLRADAPNHDLGYPASVEVAPGEILTLYYQKPDAAQRPAIMATRWRIRD